MGQSDGWTTHVGSEVAKYDDGHGSRTGENLM